MPDAFDDRENAFEKRFVNDEALHFRALARRNKALALWVAEMKGISGEAAAKHAEDFVAAQVGRSDDDVAVALREDLARGDIDLSDNRLRKKMEEEMTRALASVKSGA
jgi:hypothetical protein